MKMQTLNIFLENREKKDDYKFRNDMQKNKYDSDKKKKDHKQGKKKHKKRMSGGNSVSYGEMINFILSKELPGDKVKKYFTDVFNPVYDDLKQKITINKFFNIKEQTVFDSLYDEVFDTLMELINKNL